MHFPVLLDEVIKYLNPQPDKNYIDCTVGEGGHAKEILKKIWPRGKLLVIDLNKDVLALAKKNLKEFKNQIIFHCGNFINLKEIIYEYKFNRIFGILFDLGLSLYLLNKGKKGFTFQKNEPLDMKYGDEFSNCGFQFSKINAETIINTYSERKLIEILKNYGEERYAKKIAKIICKERKKKPIKTTFELVKIIKRAIPKGYEKRRIHPATKTFQALRIEVNQELENLKKALPQALDILEPAGRIVCLSYHSLEDRIIKHFFVRESKNCLCPREFPVCRCSHRARLRIITKKPIFASQEEIKKNPRARSVRMRVIEKLKI